MFKLLFRPLWLVQQIDRASLLEVHVDEGLGNTEEICRLKGAEILPQFSQVKTTINLLILCPLREVRSISFPMKLGWPVAALTHGGCGRDAVPIPDLAFEEDLPLPLRSLAASGSDKPSDECHLVILVITI